MNRFSHTFSFPSSLAEWQEAVLDFLVDVIVICVVVFLVVRPFVISPFQVKQSSMEPNVHDGEYILVWKLPYNALFGWQEYVRGDVIVFRPPTNPETYLIKRVIGLPGETVRIKDGATYVRAVGATDFVKLDDSYLAARNQGNTCVNITGTLECSEAEKAETYEFSVPTDGYFVMGDNRLSSRDARACFVARCADEGDHYLTRHDIEGRALFVFFPFAEARTIDEHSK